MNDFQITLYNDMKRLVETNEAFFTKIQTLDGVTYQVFNYRLATYTDFLNPGARETRGIMFEVDSEGNPVRLACFMPQKFFNLGEGLAANVDMSDDNIDGIMDKMDGSILSTFMHMGHLALKSKTSLISEHVGVATKWLNEHEDFKWALGVFTNHGYSVHMELTSPLLRIVLGYDEVNMTILSMREIATGKVVTYQNFLEHFDAKKHADGGILANPAAALELLNRWVPDLSVNQMLKAAQESNPDVKSVKDLVAAAKSMTGIEGYVIRLKDGEHVKIKTDWYCALHHTKDSVSAPRRLFECIINEGVDDLKGMFSEDIVTIKRIIDMETKVVRIYNGIIAEVERFYAENKDLVRKDYAIKATGLADGLMSLKMNLYQGKENDYKEFALKHIEMFDINATEVYETVEE